ncbi:MAG TPA: MoaD/ThiS family protein [Nanoarchaeota archaeon]|nr:MAG: hypothetical protein QT01_C0006G0045 [archaeon GW2011_AR6]MBS3082899.1 MoaD/ThiS family protein [Candidatus Pacearchaeota archaeon]HIH18120.1 MoaD/ThiS family protein [Nanoarchaeota archaeon]HIH34488.1 MoaD/ThiS family protein [Nanoarchaeota archaeon]HIH51569.1 MoaD/ThiS family protein [Nanoarchaeota archaeon]
MAGQVKVFFERQNKHGNLSVDKEISMAALMREMKVNPSEVIVVKNGELVTEDARVKAGDEIKFLAVISGG